MSDVFHPERFYVHVGYLSGVTKELPGHFTNQADAERTAEELANETPGTCASVMTDHGMHGVRRRAGVQFMVLTADFSCGPEPEETERFIAYPAESYSASHGSVFRPGATTRCGTFELVRPPAPGAEPVSGSVCAVLLDGRPRLGRLTCGYVYAPGPGAPADLMGAELILIPEPERTPDRDAYVERLTAERTAAGLTAPAPETKRCPACGVPEQYGNLCYRCADKHCDRCGSILVSPNAQARGRCIPCANQDYRLRKRQEARETS